MLVQMHVWDPQQGKITANEGFAEVLGLGEGWIGVWIRKRRKGSPDFVGMRAQSVSKGTEVG